MRNAHCLIPLSAILVLSTRAAYATDLSYTITSPLKSAPAGSCPDPYSDLDGDCLDDAMESALAMWASPYYLWDENENCNYYSSVDTDPNAGTTAGESHDKPRFYFQVRPISYANAPPGYPYAISAWKPDGWYHWVRITYFLNYPRDCGYPGHQGDNEGVAFDLYSQDLKTWAVGTGYYNHHIYPMQVVSGSWLHDFATSAGGYYPFVLADDSGHGSWPGAAADDDDCGDTAFLRSLGIPCTFTGSFPFISCSAFSCVTGDTVIEGRKNHNFVYPSADKNIGEPSNTVGNGHWNRNTLTVSSDGQGHELASSFEETGDASWVVGGGWENWNDPTWSPPTERRFCGWECGIRSSDGNCQFPVFGKTDCTSALFDKVARDPFYTGVAP